MQGSKYPLATTTWDEAEINAMQEVIQSRNFTMGARVLSYESEFADLFGTPHAVMSNSGSSANLLALGAIRYSSFGEDSTRNEVIVPAVSWSTTYYPITQMGYTLKFVDIDLGTLNASASSVEAAITSKTAGIVAVNLLGNPSELDRLRELADAKRIFLIEDNCESLGAQLNGKMSGTFGDIGTFSSFFSHHISTMEGGMSVTSNLELSQVMTSLRAHGWTRELPDENHVLNKSGNQFDDLFRFVLPGYNLRPLELEGAIGSEQLKKVPGIIQGRRKNHKTFASLMGQFPLMKTQVEIGESSWFGFSLILTETLSGRRSELVEILTKYGIASRPIVAGNFTRNPVMRHLKHTPLPALPNADQVHENGLFIGNHHYEMIEEFNLLESVLREFHK
jgi:CDP-6-deoxy-D-xylo-4-hexulose-3-dehydrase